ncbi:MAG: hypothetical protein V4520_00090 [Bacteroidota bacterium]
MTTIADIELETELQEMYMQATHWLQDISFLETETHFFKSIIVRYKPAVAAVSRADEFTAKVIHQMNRLNELKVKIPAFHAFLEPFIGDINQQMDLEFLDRYNMLQNELSSIFNNIRTTKKELFHYTESIMAPVSDLKA